MKDSSCSTFASFAYCEKPERMSSPDNRWCCHNRSTVYDGHTKAKSAPQQSTWRSYPLHSSTPQVDTREPGKHQHMHTACQETVRQQYPGKNFGEHPARLPSHYQNPQNKSPNQQAMYFPGILPRIRFTTPGLEVYKK